MFAVIEHANRQVRRTGSGASPGQDRAESDRGHDRETARITSMLPTEVRDSALRVSINTFIGTHLGDKDLNPDTVAAAHYISPRTLRRLFGAEQTSVSAEIRNRRLERCRHELENPKLHDTPVRAIGARWGFRERAHFNKVFKQQYGMAPLEYRERHRLQDSHPAGGGS